MRQTMQQEDFYIGFVSQHHPDNLGQYFMGQTYATMKAKLK